MDDGKFREIFEKSPIGILFFDKKGELIDSNQSALEIGRASQFKDVEGINLFVDPNIESRKEELLKNGFIRFQSSSDLDKAKKSGIYTPTDSGIIYIDYTVSVTDSGFWVQIQDISELKKAEKEAEQSKRRIREVMDSIDYPIYSIDYDWNLIFINNSPTMNETAKAMGFESCKDFVGRNVLEIFPNYMGTIVEENYRAAMEKREIRRFEAFGEVTGNWFDISVYPSFEGITIVSKDITENKKLEEELRKSNDNLELKVQERTAELDVLIDELKSSNKELQSFAYITSHDLQEPLRSIASYAQLLERRYKGQLDDDADDFLEFMAAGATRMKEQIKGLLEYSRVGTRGGDFKVFNAEKALNTALLGLKSSIDECHAEVTHEPLPVINADEYQITRVFLNLIGNALKFRREGVQPKIHVSALKTDNEYIFSVSDNGIGIEPQYSDRIFEVFKRLHAIGEYEGAGIGLAIVKRIIDRHGGHIWVDSEFGVGTTFYFTIPLKMLKNE